MIVSRTKGLKTALNRRLCPDRQSALQMEFYAMHAQGETTLGIQMCHWVKCLGWGVTCDDMGGMFQTIFMMFSCLTSSTPMCLQLEASRPHFNYREYQ